MRTSYSVLTQTQTVQYSLLHTYAIWYSLFLLGYKPVQHVTVLNIVGNCKTMLSIVILYFNIMGQPSYMRSVVGRNVVMRHITVYSFLQACNAVPPYQYFATLLYRLRVWYYKVHLSVRPYVHVNWLIFRTARSTPFFLENASFHFLGICSPKVWKCMRFFTAVSLKPNVLNLSKFRENISM